MLAMLTIGQQCKREVFQVILWGVQFHEKYESWNGLCIERAIEFGVTRMCQVLRKGWLGGGWWVCDKNWEISKLLQISKSLPEPIKVGFYPTHYKYFLWVPIESGSNCHPYWCGSWLINEKFKRLRHGVSSRINA